MQRIHLPKTKFSDILILSEEWIYHQLTRVLRSRVGNTFIFFDGETMSDYLYEITHIDSREVKMKKLETIEKLSESPAHIHLYQALPNKLSKIEYIIQKWVEVGISNFYIYSSERSQQLRISNSKQQRLEKIIQEATEQSNRNVIPKLYMFDQVDIDDVEWDNVYLHTTSWSDVVALRDIQLSKTEDINIWVWPEGGFSDNEIQSFENKNYKKLYLWDRVLRTETAWVVVWFFIAQMFL